MCHGPEHTASVGDVNMQLNCQLKVIAPAPNVYTSTPWMTSGTRWPVLVTLPFVCWNDSPVPVLSVPNIPPVASSAITVSPVAPKNSSAVIVTDSGVAATAPVVSAETDASKPSTKHPST